MLEDVRDCMSSCWVTDQPSGFHRRGAQSSKACRSVGCRWRESRIQPIHVLTRAARLSVGTGPMTRQSLCSTTLLYSLHNACYLSPLTRTMIVISRYTLVCILSWPFLGLSHLLLDRFTFYWRFSRRFWSIARTVHQIAQCRFEVHSSNVLI